MTDESKAAASNEALINAITDLLGPLLNGMEALGYIARRLHPPHLAELVASVADVDELLRQGLETFRVLDWPAKLAPFVDQMVAAAAAVCLGFDGLREAAQAPDGTSQAYRGIRQNAKAMAALYPAARMLPPISVCCLTGSSRKIQTHKGAKNTSESASKVNFAAGSTVEPSVNSNSPIPI